MDELILDIAHHLRTLGPLSHNDLAAIIRAHNAGIRDVSQHFSKKRLYPAFLQARNADPQYWRERGIDETTENLLVQTLQMKPRRTASGVATITVITKPWKCANSCLYCPNDIRMPKSYLANEPACQRAERNYFDPYLQVASRMKALTEMGHPTDKVELIVLGGTWCDYPLEYQMWYITRLFEALDDRDEARHQRAQQIRKEYRTRGFANTDSEIKTATARIQQHIADGNLNYNTAWDEVYGASRAWQDAAQHQSATWEQLEKAQRTNEHAAHRVVGLVVETRPGSITPEQLVHLRRFGCTKLQMGVQTLQPDVIATCRRSDSAEQGPNEIAKAQAYLESAARAFDLARLFGFKIHAHFMANLPGSTPAADRTDYLHFVTNPAWMPDEVKLYPTVMVADTGLHALYENGTWTPYPEDDLTRLLADDVLTTPPFMRISRMIRDFSAGDILAGSKKTNLRQMVEQHVAAESEARGIPVQEIRYREIGTQTADLTNLSLNEYRYETTSTTEWFLQWVTPENRIAGFLRLSIPREDAIEAITPFDSEEVSSLRPGVAMIREVHVYGHVAQLHRTSAGAQHLGLGRQLIEHACTIAQQQGCHAINVISSVGTREYYRARGFADNGLYQQRPLS